MRAQRGAEAFKAVLAGKVEKLEEGFEPLAPRTPAAAQFLELLTLDELYRAAKEILAGRHTSLGPPVEALLEHYGHHALVAGRTSEALPAIEYLQRLRPDDIGVRVWLAGALGTDGDPDRIVELFAPLIPSLIENPESYAPYFRTIVTAAVSARRIDVLVALGQNPPVSRLHADTMIDIAFRRGFDLRDAGVDAAELRAIVGSLGDALAGAMTALDEYSFMQAVDTAEAEIGGASLYEGALRHAFILAKLAWANGWSRAFRKSLAAAARIAAAGGGAGTMEGVWQAVGLPRTGFEAFAILTKDEGQDRRSASQTQHTLLSAFNDMPSLEVAERVWEAAYAATAFESLARFSPSTLLPTDPASRVRALHHARKGEGAAVPIWILVPWLKGADRLLRVLAAYAGQATTVVTVGGDGAPPDLDRLSVLLLADGMHILSRPVVSWGGQRGVHYNMFEVLDAFADTAPADAWLQIACDRSYPTLPLQRVALRTASRTVRLQQVGAGPPAWHKEWPEEVLATLPQRYHAALEEGFRTGLPTEYLRLATKSPYYGDNDSRLYPSIFNFSSQPLLADASSWHNYMVSGFEVDVRWMSFARLQAFVDVSTETRTTFSRRNHPTVTKWVHQVLSKYDLRTGSPWVYISRNFVKTVFEHPDFPELYSALDLGFAPEMNFFDTAAASFNLFDDFHHTYHVFGEQAAHDSELAAACISSDRDGLTFIRKTDPDGGAQLLRFFADRIFENDSVETLHWAVKLGPGEARGDVDPRPALDGALVDRLTGAAVCIRDFLGRMREQARFMPHGVIQGDNGGALASWTFDDGVLQVAYDDPVKGVKRYKSVGGDAKVLTLAPAELVSVGNRWSAFLDFDLQDVGNDPSVTEIARCSYQAMVQVFTTWAGAGQADAGLLAALSDEDMSNFPTPTIRAEGCIHELRASSRGPLALASLDGFPTLLAVTGFAWANSATVLEFERARDEDVAAWAQGEGEDNIVRDDVLRLADLVGAWTLTTLYGVQSLNLLADNWIHGETGQIVGRWIARADGVQFFGLPGLVFGLADQVRLTRGVWRLSGWGWLNMKDSVTFSLKRSS